MPPSSAVHGGQYGTTHAALQLLYIACGICGCRNLGLFLPDLTRTYLSIDGQVIFQYDASFTGNTVKNDGDSRAHEGGGLCVAPTGDVRFEGSSSFVENVAESGGSGSAVANFGDLVFKGTSFYESNHARGEFSGVFLSALVNYDTIV